jgi:hypothetical protein
MDEELVARLDAYVERLGEQHRGMDFTLASAIRVLVVEELGPR